MSAPGRGSAVRRGAARVAAATAAAAFSVLVARCAARPLDAVVLGATADAGQETAIDGESAPIDDAGTLDDGSATYVWPNQFSHTNSDPWIAQHHDQIVAMQPEVLVLNFANDYDAAATAELVDEHIAAFREASRYHGYADASAPAFLDYQLKAIVDLRDGTSAVNSALLPVDDAGVDYAALNDSAFAARIGIDDPDNPGTPLNLCGLFEKGIIHEVWGMVDDPATVKFDPSAETKQAYDDDDVPIAGDLVCVSNGQCITQALPCKVSTRLVDFNPNRGAGCHLFDTGQVFENYITRGALPAFARVARTFFNFDFEERFNAPFASFYDVCKTTMDPCIEWPSETHAVSGPQSTASFDFAPMSAGCGNVSFPPNATTLFGQTNDLTVLTSCEHYGLHDGPDGGDKATPYSNALAAADYAGDTNVATDCGGTQPTYILASMPGLGTQATSSNGTAMKNWWVYLFY